MLLVSVAVTLVLVDPCARFCTSVDAMCTITFHLQIDPFCAGQPARLTYGIDSAGNTCGHKNTWNGLAGPDLTEYKKLYYLNPLELLDSNTFLGARSVCVKECPGATDVCGLANLPCRSNNQYRCNVIRLHPFTAALPFQLLIKLMSTLQAFLACMASRQPSCHTPMTQ